MENIPDILILENKERFRRKLLIATRVIATFFVLSIVFVGFIQIKYVNEVNKIKLEYGERGYCYLCGLETGRSCSCNFVPDIEQNREGFNWSGYLQNIAFQNAQDCENRNSYEYKNPNLSEIIIK